MRWLMQLRKSTLNMDDQTSLTPKPKEQRVKESRIFGVSLRGLIALLVILTVCYMSISVIEVKEPLYTLAGLIVGFYFGQNQKQPNQ